MTDPMKKASALLTLGDNCRNNLQDDPKALDAYARIMVLNLGNSYITLSAVVASANILNKQGKHDEALAVLGKVDISTLGGTWLAAFLSAQAEICVSQGKAPEAIAKLTAAAAVKDLPASLKAQYEKRIAELQSKP
jgi:predicted Zn-dependent protease